MAPAGVRPFLRATRAHSARPKLAARRIDVPSPWHTDGHGYTSGLQYRAKLLDAFSSARCPVLEGDRIVGDQVYEGVDRNGEIRQFRSHARGVVDAPYHRVFERYSPSAGPVERREGCHELREGVSLLEGNQ